MRIVWLKNKYMYGAKDNGVHPYCVFFDRKNKQYNAIPITHLYNKDSKRFNQLKKGLIYKEKFRGFDCPSAINRYYLSKNFKGGKIDIYDKIFAKNLSNYLPKNQSNRIKSFSKKRKC